jgi:hypothetical protein
MKFPVVVAVTAIVVASVRSQTSIIRTPPLTTVASIPGPISEGTPADPASPPVLPDFQIEGTQVRRVEVVEPPPMEGLPPVAGTITLKVHHVADPGLPDPPAPLPPLAADDPLVVGSLGELRANYRDTRIVFVSATVYDRAYTRLTCYPDGVSAKAVTVWSNVDFNHYTGFATFEVTGTDGEVRGYALLMGIGNQHSERHRELLASSGIEYEEPEIPVFTEDGPSFVMLTENPEPEGVKLVEDLHALYRHEGKRMAEACAAREKAREERMAYLLANPPKPKDVTVNFWKRQKPAASRAEGGQP